LFTTILRPRTFFDGIDDATAAGCNKGRQQLHELKKNFDLGLTFSEYSKEELTRIGFKKTAVIPMVANIAKFHLDKNGSNKNQSANFVNFLHVGRIIPHKKIEDILKVFAFYKKCINDKSKLLIIGKYDKNNVYFLFLQEIIKKLDLQDVEFITDVSDESLASYYEKADIYLSMSEHEGFSIPLVECMYHQVPILAFNAAAIPDTLGNAGLLLEEKKFDEIAELIQIVIEDKKFREKIVLGQNERLEYLDGSGRKSEFIEKIKQFEKNPSFVRNL